jgi:phosphoglycolate phosphatase
MYKAVVFDLDGTLLNTITDISDSVNAVLKSLNYHEFSEEQYKYFVGRGVDELISAVISKGELDPELFYEIKSGYLEEYARRKSSKTKPYPGILDLLTRLIQHKIAICILSNKPHHQTVEVVDKYFKDISFNIVSGKKPEFPIKPNPASLNDMIKKLNLNLEEILYVGDTNTDIETAKNANLASVGVLWGFRKIEELEQAGATYIVNTVDELFSIIKGD